jgi:mono/diheme cytochrome c family protein
LTLVPSLEGEPTKASVAVEPSPAPEGGDAENGAAIFGANCAACHGENAAGGSVGPTLVSAEVKAKEDDYYREVILNGIQGAAMPAWGDRLGAQEIEDVIAFLRSLQ